jgi:hypothetical protein
VSGCERERERERMCTCVCVCVCEINKEIYIYIEREREREGGRDNERRPELCLSLLHANDPLSPQLHMLTLVSGGRVVRRFIHHVPSKF